jgi:DNA-binding NarL/FixJ family response regulator
MISLTNLQIGVETGLSVVTVEKHVSNLRKSMEVKDIEGNNLRVSVVNKMWLASLEAG